MARGQDTSGAKSPSQTGRLVCVLVCGVGAGAWGPSPPCGLLSGSCPLPTMVPGNPFQPWGRACGPAHLLPRCPVPGRAEAASQPPRASRAESGSRPRDQGRVSDGGTVAAHQPSSRLR